MVHVIGIDLGTTYSAVGVIGVAGKPEILPNREGERITPSVVFFQGDQTLVGSQAKRSAPTSPDDVVQFVKRQMGEPNWRFMASDGAEYSAEQVSAIILRRLKEDAEAALGETVTDAVITVPAFFDDARRKATKDAGLIAGLNVRRIINEPTAAALAYGLDSAAAGTVLVYDLGGGTFDVTVMKIGNGEFDVIATSGDRNLGGFDWDNALMVHINEQIVAQGGPDLSDDDMRTAELRDKAELAKRALTTMTSTKVFVTADGRNFNVQITREQFEEITRSLLSRTCDLTESTLEEAGLTWSQIDQLLLVGGSTHMPMVREAVGRLSGKTPERSISADEAVALGAAVQAHLCETESSGQGMAKGGGGGLAGLGGRRVVINDVTAHGLGSLALEGEGGPQRNFVIVAPNTKIPAKGGEDFQTVQENQAGVLVEITEGDDPDPEYVTVVGSGEFKLPRYPKGAPIRINIAYDIDAIIFAEVIDLTSGKKLGDMEIERKANMTKEQLDAAITTMRKIEVN